MSKWRSRMPRKRLVLPALLILGGLAVYAVSNGALGPLPQVHAFLGERAVRILATAERVEVFRIDSHQHLPRKNIESQTKDRIGGYKITGTGQEQGRDFAAKIRKLLFSRWTFSFDVPKLCKFAPGVAFRLWHNGEFVDVLLCFSCDDVQVLRPGEDKTPIAEFAFVRPQFVRLAKEAFPDDPEIQSLPEKRH